MKKYTLLILFLSISSISYSQELSSLKCIEEMNKSANKAEKLSANILSSRNYEKALKYYKLAIKNKEENMHIIYSNISTIYKKLNLLSAELKVHLS